MNTIKMLNEALETKYHLNEAKEDKERFLSFINATIKDNIKSQAIVDNFDKLKSSGRIKGEEADYYYWIKNKSVNELQDFLNAFNSTPSKTQTKKQEKAGAELMPCSNPDWVIYKITTYSASKYYGENTHWCITGRNGPNGIGAFKDYKKEGVKDYYFLWKIGNEKNGKWCYLDYGKELQLDNYWFYDAQDNSYTIEDVDIPEDVLSYLPGTQNIIDYVKERQKITAEVQRTGVYIYNPLDDCYFIRKVKPKKIIIPDNVKEIEARAFEECLSLKEVVVSDSVEKIGLETFSSCEFLQKINLPSSVKEIGHDAFYNCVSLKEITIPNSVEKIGAGAFNNCASLKNITIPDSIKEIGYATFGGCYSLKEINLPNSVEKIGNNTFFDCTSLQKINLPSSVKEIGNNTFFDCTSLKEILLPDSIKEIRNYTFENCTSLKEINIPDRVEKIGYWVFAGCTFLQNITLPSSLKEIGKYVFFNCTSLQEIKIKGEYRPQIFKYTGINDRVILNWIDAGIKETWGSTKI